MVQSHKEDITVLVRRDATGLMTRSGTRQAGFRLFYRGRPFDPRLVERVSADFVQMASLQQPGIARLFVATVESDGTTRLHLENVSGISLADYLLSWGTPDETLTRRLWGSLLHALKPLHELGIPYGTLRPDRIWVKTDGSIVLPEPGVGYLCCHSGQSGKGLQRSRMLEMFGDPWLVPPEILSGEGGCTPASDCFQVASIVATWRMGHNPFGDGRALEIQNRMIRGQLLGIDGNPALGPEEERFFKEGLSLEPGRRLRGQARLLAWLAPREGSTRLPPLNSNAKIVEYAATFAPLEDSEILKELGQQGVSSEELSQVDGERLVEQLIGMGGRTKAASSSRGTSGWWLLAAVLALVIALLPRIMGSQQVDVPYTGGIASDSDGLTHHDMVWPEGSSGAPHPRAESLMETIPVKLKERIEALNVPVRGEFRFEPPILPPYKIVCEGDDKIAIYYFSSRNRLDSIRFGKELFRIYYRATGLPGVIWHKLPDSEGRYIPIKPIKNEP